MTRITLHVRHHGRTRSLIRLSRILRKPLRVLFTPVFASVLFRAPNHYIPR